MKEGSDNFRESSIVDVMNILNKNNLEIYLQTIYKLITFKL